jgi:hypothetical protein
MFQRQRLSQTMKLKPLGMSPSGQEQNSDRHAPKRRNQRDQRESSHRDSADNLKATQHHGENQHHKSNGKKSKLAYDHPFDAERVGRYAAYGLCGHPGPYKNQEDGKIKPRTIFDHVFRNLKLIDS